MGNNCCASADERKSDTALLKNELRGESITFKDGESKLAATCEKLSDQRLDTQDSSMKEIGDEGELTSGPLSARGAKPVLKVPDEPESDLVSKTPGPAEAPATSDAESKVSSLFRCPFDTSILVPLGSDFSHRKFNLTRLFRMTMTRRSNLNRLRTLQLPSKKLRRKTRNSLKRRSPKKTSKRRSKRQLRARSEIRKRRRRKRKNCRVSKPRRLSVARSPKRQPRKTSNSKQHRLPKARKTRRRTRRTRKRNERLIVYVAQ